jgi:hypothetical protein
MPMRTQRKPRAIALGACCMLAAAHAVPALAADPPVLKSGLWEVTRVNSQQPDHKSVTTMCLDESVQAQMREFGMGAAKEMCSQNERSFAGNRMTLSATCKMGPTTMKTTAVMVFNGNTSYHMDGSSTFDPPMLNTSQVRTTIDARWVGACRAGQQVGDVTLETGQTINIKQMMTRPQAPPAALAPPPKGAP